MEHTQNRHFSTSSPTWESTIQHPPSYALLAITFLYFPSSFNLQNTSPRNEVSTSSLRPQPRLTSKKRALRSATKNKVPHFSRNHATKNRTTRGVHSFPTSCMTGQPLANIAYTTPLLDGERANKQTTLHGSHKHSKLQSSVEIPSTCPLILLGFHVRTCKGPTITTTKPFFIQRNAWYNAKQWAETRRIFRRLSRRGSHTCSKKRQLYWRTESQSQHIDVSDFNSRIRK